ncbi:uncharacterized protein LOC106754319 [Vigna radiata var. radiata]|uniref:Uncharacterized protein LOC106754319 n=1 Tax=Vigna radiata var. radiata TaxID=3916 RepID=A0A1S3TDJ5_VIGRR|nr:uncharacterized protein LOC106754319 [Vigna radiata var. radiata]
MVTTRNTTVEDPAEAIRALRQQMEDMRRQHERELSAVREECAARIAREREIREKGKDLSERQQEDEFRNSNGQEGTAEHSSASDKTWKLEDTELEGSQVRTERITGTVNTAPVGGAPLVKEEEVVEGLPFTRAIMDVHISEHFVPPQLSIYDGTTDPDDHIQAFSTRMAFRTGNRAIWCRAFSLSLEGEALEWFNALPAGSIQSFEGLKEMFGRQFAGSRAEDPTVFELSNLRQGKDETLKAFMDRYQKMVRRVKGLNVELALQYVMPALRPGPFKDSVCRKRPKTMEELRERAADEMRVEEMKQAYKKENQELKEKAEGKKPDGSSRTGSFKPREAPQGPKFQQYTPLNAPPARILQEALSVNLIPPLKKRPTPAGADGNKDCLYHQNMGHTTEECVTLRDKIEELIRAGHLKQYIKTAPAEPQRGRGPSPASRRDQGRSPSRPLRRTDNRSSYDNRRRRSRSRSGDRDRSIRGRINTISGGFAGGGPSTSARKRHVRALRSVNSVQATRKSMPPITFTDDDFHAPDLEQDDPMVITAEIARYEVGKFLVDQGSSANILYWKTFLQMDLSEELIVPFHEQIVGFAGERVDTKGYVDLRTRLGTGRDGDEKKVRYLLVDANTSYNVLLGRPCLNSFGAIVSTPHLTLKYPNERKRIITVRADQKTARECYAAGLRMYPRVPRAKVPRSEVAMAELDPRVGTEDRMEPHGTV